MTMNPKTKLAVKRITKDLQEIQKNPLEGIGIAQYGDNFFEYVVNIKIIDGIYKDYCLQLYLTFPQTYPTNPPKMLIFPGQSFTHEYHEHVFPDYMGYMKFCFDILESDFMSSNEAHTGWNPSYSISFFLLQVQNFLSNPDLPDHLMPNKGKVKRLLDSMKSYQFKFKSEGEEKFHTWENPFPEICHEKTENEKVPKKDEDENLDTLRNNLICFVTKLNYVDDPDIIMGYPIILEQIGRKKKIELYPIPELLTYDAFIAQIQRDSIKLDLYFSTNFKSANNEMYNHWLPIYINSKHFEKNKTTILNSFSIIKFGPSGKEEYDFKTNYIFDVMPILLNKMIIGISNNKSSLSESFVRCYFQYILLFKKLTEIYSKELNYYIKKVINAANHEISKYTIPDIGNLLMLLCFTDFNVNDKLMDNLIIELFVRQIYWIFQSQNLQEDTKNFIIDGLIQEKIMKSFRDSKKKKFKVEFIKDCKNLNIWDKILDLFTKDPNSIKNYEETLIKEKKDKKTTTFIDYLLNRQHFTDTYNACQEKTKDEIDYIILKNLKAENYILYKKELKENEIKQLKTKYDENIFSVLKMCDKALQENFLSHVFQSQKGNNLLILTTIARNKITEDNFLNKLEKQYGVLLNDELQEIITDMKEKQFKIKTYEQLFDFIGCSHLLNKDNKFQKFLEFYNIALNKGYTKNFIAPEIIKPFNSSYSYIIPNQFNQFLSPY